jgi:hypothetical protein
MWCLAALGFDARSFVVWRNTMLANVDILTHPADEALHIAGERKVTSTTYDICVY